MSEHPYSHLIDLNDYPVEWWNKVISLGASIYAHPQRYVQACAGKIMATLFYEPSTRTQMSFQSAMIRLGGSIIGFDNPMSSSVSKGENIKDTTKVVSSYSDILIIRHPLAGTAKAAALTAECPVVNAGDGGHLHPTQTLTDLLTLKMEKGRLDHLTVGLCGDLLYGRTVHSLCKALSCYPENKFVLISTPELQIPEYIIKILRDSGCEYRLESSLDEAIGDLDVLYMTRIQRERFASQAEYLAQKDVYRLTTEKMKRAKDDLVVLHPLPRVDEIEIAVDDDPRAMYFKQAKYGMYVRMALILRLLESEKPAALLRGVRRDDVCCVNPKCITAQEHYLPHQFTEIGGRTVCEFCEEAAVPAELTGVHR
ncbi:MAG: aspartate carbamoyltransferase [Oscillospiraceae bacterium]|nr:aspartate carbamoyltransferase [Oscillospiraceae bacterium]MBR5362845.1 aspartate carbamoyltransferase [Oscillospiraceae bacterium]